MRKRTLAFLVLGVFAAALTACGVGAATDEENVSKTATTYLRALADGDTAKACIGEPTGYTVRIWALDD